jgi:tetratricopeptide (TPR) repeat protein
MAKQRAEKGPRFSILFCWCRLRFPSRGIALIALQSKYVGGDRRRVCTSKRRIACACIALILFRSPGTVSAQSVELAVVSALIQQGNLVEAEQRLHRYLLKLPHSAKANNLLGQVYFRQGHYEQAEDALQKAIAGAPALVGPRLNLGDAFLAEGKIESSISAYQGACKIAPHDARANLALAKLFLGTGEFAKSLEAAGNIPAEKRTAELLPTLAADYFGLQQPEKAGVEIQAMLQVAEKQPDLVPELAEFFLVHGDFKSSQQLLSLAQAKQLATDRFLIDLARTQAGLGQLNEAQNTLESVLARTPDSLDALVAAGQVAKQQSDWAAAEEAFSLAAKLAPDRPDILYGLASAQLYGNQTTSALKTAQKLHSLTPEDLRSTYLLALALFGVKQWEEAKPFAEQVLTAHSDDREMNLVLADIAFNDERNLPVARRHVDICLKSNPEDPGALYYLGMIQKMEGDVTGAIKSLSKSVTGNARNADAQGALGALYLQAGNVQGAMQALEQAVLLAPEESQNHYQLALAYSRANARDKAKAQLEIYQQMKTKEAKEAKDFKGPSTSEVPMMRISPRP